MCTALVLLQSLFIVLCNPMAALSFLVMNWWLYWLAFGIAYCIVGSLLLRLLRLAGLSRHLRLAIVTEGGVALAGGYLALRMPGGWSPWLELGISCAVAFVVAGICVSGREDSDMTFAENSSIHQRSE